MKPDAKKLTRAIELLGEIASQDFVTDALWECKELRRWKRKVLKLMTECGYVYEPTSEEPAFQSNYETPGDRKCSPNSEPAQ